MWIMIGDSALIKNMLMKNRADVAYLADEYGWNYTERTHKQRTAIADEIYMDIQKEYGNDVLFASSEDEKEKLENFTHKKVIFMPTSIVNIIKNASSIYKSVYKDAVRKVQENAESEEYTVKEKIYAWAQKRCIANSYLHELFDILGDRVDANANDITEELRNERIFTYQKNRLMNTIYTQLTTNTSNIFEALGLKDDYENEEEMLIKAHDLIDDIYHDIVSCFNYDEKTAVSDYMGDILDEVNSACDRKVSEMLSALKEQ